MPTFTDILELHSMIRDHALEIDRLHAALDIQFTRIAQMQAELDVLPHARKRREALRALLTQPPAPNGNGGPHT